MTISPWGTLLTVAYKSRCVRSSQRDGADTVLSTALSADVCLTHTGKARNLGGSGEPSSMQLTCTKPSN